VAATGGRRRGGCFVAWLGAAEDEHLVAEVGGHAQDAAEGADVGAEGAHLGVGDVTGFDAADAGLARSPPRH
jgi:hypothetical protein